jgi:transcriptional regulator with XRE-family HTH domain
MKTSTSTQQKHFSGALIKQYREKTGLTQAAVAKIAGSSRPQLAELESGSVANPTIKTIQAIAKALGCQVTDFFITPEEADRTATEKKSVKKKGRVKP